MSDFDVITGPTPVPRPAGQEVERTVPRTRIADATPALPLTSTSERAESQKPHPHFE